jgi:glycerophosphoryl diester phosphodiesterase
MRFSPQMRRLDWLVARPIAHRGLHDKSRGIIENTSSAFAAAMAGNYSIECDLQITADGEIVVFHDDTLDRLTGESGLVKVRTTKELRRVAIRNSGDHMQTLSELLDQVGGRVPLAIELKSHWDGHFKLAARALKVLEPYAGPYALMSFDPDMVAAVAELSPRTVRGIIADKAVHPYYNFLPVERRIGLRHFTHLAHTRPHFMSYHFRDLPFAPVQQFRAAGFPVITWTIRSREEESQALRYCDQVTFEGYIA